jgi:hypothetical protein
MWNCPLKTRISLSFCAFRSGASAPFLGKNKYICGGFGVSVGTLDSLGSSGDLVRRKGKNHGSFNNYRNHEK